MVKKREELISIRPIGVIRSCFPEKFGIPRQAGMVKEARARIELLPPYNRSEFVKGLDQFSHIWVHFLFHAAISSGWRPTVRPPGLGGQKRVGVFASRSPHRPNHLGMSAVELLSLERVGAGVVLKVAGGDFLDGTPVLDIKPYLPYSDGVCDATTGYGGRHREELSVIFSRDAREFCTAYEKVSQRRLDVLIKQVIQQDPRPASQHNVKGEFGMLLWDINVRWRVKNGEAVVESCSRGNGGERQGKATG